MEKPTRIELRFACPKRWDELAGSGPRRHCATCDLSVTHLSYLTRAEAEPVLAARKQGRVCLAYRTDAQGNVVFADSVRRSAPRWLQAAAAFLALVFPFLPGCRRASLPGTSSASPTLGGPASKPVASTLEPLSCPTGREAVASPTADPDLHELVELMGYGGE